MSTKAIVWIIVILLIILGVWYFWSSHNSPQTAPATSSTAQTSSQTTGSPQTLSSGESNADLNADLNAIDTQTNSANSDSASVDQSFNDQPVQQTE
jgi:predicted negative regulator of RcsB-dependent stress response